MKVFPKKSGRHIIEFIFLTLKSFVDKALVSLNFSTNLEQLTVWKVQSTMLIVYYHLYWHYYHTNELFTLAYLLHIYISYRRNQCHKSIWTSSPRIICVGIKFMCKNTLFFLPYLLDKFNSSTESVYLTSRMPIKQI